MQKWPIDLCVMDFDDCIYPGISKVAIAIDITFQVAFSPLNKADRKFLPNLGYAGLYLLGFRTAQKIFGHPTNGELIQHYQKLLRKIPEPYFTTSASHVIPNINPGVLETYHLLSSHMPVGVISLALEPVLDALNAELQENALPGLSFMHGNSFRPALGGLSHPVLTSEHKRTLLQETMQRLGRRIPLVIGNDQEDLGMVDLAHQAGGCAIGINPPRQIKDRFDFSLYTHDWAPVSELITRLLA